jgi:ABC-2 type transport system ATP-binding protein
MKPVLKADSLVKKYGEITAVDDISFEIYHGEIFGFLGPNGAGKTTTIRMMSGLLKPDSGQVVISADKNGRSIGLCPQHIVIWENLTCFEQILFMGQMYNLPYKDARVREELLGSLVLMDRNRLAKIFRRNTGRLNVCSCIDSSHGSFSLNRRQAHP